MPELPEVETIARGLAACLPGRRIVAARLGKTDFVDNPEELARALPGCIVRRVERYGKFLLLRLAAGNGAAGPTLLIHLGMTGQLIPQRADVPRAPHTHVVLSLDDGTEVRYTDLRRFGRMALVADGKLHSILGSLGPDPLQMAPGEFVQRLAARRAMVKALLLDQRTLRGLGNIYADESLWRARIHPARQAARLRRDQLLRLHRSVRAVLSAAIRLGGSSIANYRNAQGEPGLFQLNHRVYHREGRPCPRCRARIRRVIVAGRSSYFCPLCQRRPKGFKR